LKVSDLLALSYDIDRLPVRPDVSYNPIKVFTDTWQRGHDVGVGAVNEPFHIKKKNFTETTAAAPWYIRWPVQLVRMVTGWDEVPFLGLALELPNTLTRVLRCDVPAVIYCTEHRFSVITAIFISLIALSILGAIFSTVGIPLVSTLLSLLGFTGLTMFIAFGMSPSCLPIVPTCIFESLVADFVYWFPEKITIPHSLLSCQHDQTLGPVKADCIVECSETPFFFKDATANFGWVLCEYAPTQCQQLQAYLYLPGNTVSSILGIEFTDVVRASLYRSEIVIKSGDTNMKEAFSWCNTLSLYQLIPLVVIVFLAVVAIPILLAVIIQGIVSIIRTALAVYVLSHL
jgi:hypothetical protein